jgi:hypothetical protein
VLPSSPDRARHLARRSRGRNRDRRSVGGKTSNTFSVPGTESTEVSQILAAKLPAASGGSAQVVFADTKGSVTSSADEPAINAALKKLGSHVPRRDRPPTYREPCP